MPEIGLYEAMSTARAVRRLRPDPIADDVLARVLQAAVWAPTGGNRQPWRIVVVGARATKERLGALYAERWNKFSQQYRTLIPHLPDLERTPAERMLASGDYLATHFADVPVVAVFCFNPQEMAITDAKLDRVSVVGGASIYPAVQNLLLACRAEGLGAVLTTLLCSVERAVQELLAIPPPWATAAAVPIGYPIGSGHGALTRRSVETLTFAEAWGAPWRPART
jgi:nitroreductase